MQKLADVHMWQETILDMLIEEDHEAAKALLEELRPYPDLEKLADVHMWQETILDMLIEEDHEAAKALLEELRPYPDLEIDGLQLRLERQSMAAVNASHQTTKLARMPLPQEAFFGEKNVHQQ
ncbi:hypothetical protein Y032_0348g3173 [Ancylostoma ceylanicum]|uniref:Uncharacterized protein n=1 Tax=Ancylostoma ceylanicum TaxID=53326 RepID=A0A016RXQ4_9BILA|nr:hypothetical protein Y032_0348g3173 [Ancylostoma ceylanicum]